MTNEQICARIDPEVMHYLLLQDQVKAVLSAELRSRCEKILITLEIKIATLCLELELKELINTEL